LSGGLTKEFRSCAQLFSTAFAQQVINAGVKRPGYEARNLDAFARSTQTAVMFFSNSRYHSQPHTKITPRLAWVSGTCT